MAPAILVVGLSDVPERFCLLKNVVKLLRWGLRLADEVGVEVLGNFVVRDVGGL